MPVNSGNRTVKLGKLPVGLAKKKPGLEKPGGC
jgi:hypothetical protein